MKLKPFIFIFTLFFFISTVFFPLVISQLNFFNNYDSTDCFSYLEFDITIPDDYSKIQEGVDNANSGEIIFVRSGIYKENIVIDIENLTIIGEDKTNTIIDGRKFLAKDTMQITGPNVTISG